jgi:methyl-accepting chemotaxis protein
MRIAKRGWWHLADLPIYAKVSLAPGLILCVLLLLSLVSLRMLNTNEAYLHAISERAFPTYQRAAEMKDAVNAIQTALQHTLSVAANESDAARIQNVMLPVHQAITGAAASLDRLQQQIQQQHEALELPRKSFEAYRAAANEVLQTAASDAATATMLMAEADTQFAKLSGELDGYKSRADAASQNMSREAIGDAGRQRLLLMSGLVLAIVVCSLMMMAISRAIGRPIMRLTGRMAAMAEDDLDREIPALGRGDEIGAMARAVEVFRCNGLQAHHLAAVREDDQAAKQRRQTAMDLHTADFGTSIAGVMGSLGGSAETMRRAAGSMADAAAQVYREASTTAEGASKASADLASVAAAIEQLTASVDEISRQVATVSDVAHQAVASAGTGQTTMRELAEAASRIGDVVHLISAIAGQTNLLALNATIEAARAGDAGKGFAVVAGEVKSLAAQTAKATSDIDRQIASVRSAAAASLAAMTDVGTVIGKMDQVTAAIAAAVEQQTATTRELAANVQAVAGATDQTARAMESVAGVADTAGSVSRTVLETADGIGREAANLHAEVDNFLATVRNDSQDRRRYERIAGNAAPVGLHVSGGAVASGALRDLSRGGAVLACDLTLTVGAEIDVNLPNAGGPVTARVVRSGGGMLAVVFHQDATALARIDHAMDAITDIRSAA